MAEEMSKLIWSVMLRKKNTTFLVILKDSILFTSLENALELLSVYSNMKIECFKHQRLETLDNWFFFFPIFLYEVSREELCLSYTQLK